MGKNGGKAVKKKGQRKNEEDPIEREKGEGEGAEKGKIGRGEGEKQRK